VPDDTGQMQPDRPNRISSYVVPDQLFTMKTGFIFVFEFVHCEIHVQVLLIVKQCIVASIFTPKIKVAWISDLRNVGILPQHYTASQPRRGLQSENPKPCLSSRQHNMQDRQHHQMILSYHSCCASFFYL